MMLFAETDWGKIIETFIATLPATFAAMAGVIIAITGLVVGIRGRKDLNAKIDKNTELTKDIGNEAARKVKDTTATIAEAVNGKMQELLEAAKKAAFADGQTQSFSHELKAFLERHAAELARLEEHRLNNTRRIEAIQAEIARLSGQASVSRHEKTEAAAEPTHPRDAERQDDGRPHG